MPKKKGHKGQKRPNQEQLQQQQQEPLPDPLAGQQQQQQQLKAKLQQANNVFHKIGVASKAVDTSVNALRFIAEPSFNNTVKVGTDVAQLYGMSYGFTKLSLPLAVAPIAYQVYQGQYQEAAISGVTSLAFMATPLALEYRHPALGLTYVAGMTAYTGYNAATNAYSFYQEGGFSKVGENVKYVYDSATYDNIKSAGSKA